MADDEVTHNTPADHFSAVARPAHSGRPGGVWAVSLVFGSISSFQLFSLFGYVTGAWSVDPARAARYQELLVVEAVAMILIHLIALVGFVLLFFLKREAVFVLAAWFLTDVASLIYGLLESSWLEDATFGSWRVMILSLALRAAITEYAWRLDRKGWLEPLFHRESRGSGG